MDENTASKRHIIVGRIAAPKGRSGELVVEVTSDHPGRFSPGGTVYLDDHPHRILRSVKLPKGKVSLALEGIDTREQAERLRQSYLTVPEDEVPPLPEGQYYHFQIVDLRVYTQEGEYLGCISQILLTGSNDVYVVSEGGKEILIPALEDVIKEVDVKRGTMTVDLPDGLRTD